MTIKKATERARLTEILRSLGFTFDEAQSLIRIEMTLHSWGEHECNGNIQREGDDGEGKPRWYGMLTTNRQSYPIPDRERGALKRLRKIIGDRNTRVWVASGNPSVATTAVRYYHQTDPRGAALYILRPGDVPEGKDVGAYYSRGICVCGR